MKELSIKKPGGNVTITFDDRAFKYFVPKLSEEDEKNNLDYITSYFLNIADDQRNFHVIYAYENMDNELEIAYATPQPLNIQRRIKISKIKSSDTYGKSMTTHASNVNTHILPGTFYSLNKEDAERTEEIYSDQFVSITSELSDLYEKREMVYALQVLENEKAPIPAAPPAEPAFTMEEQLYDTKYLNPLTIPSLDLFADRVGDLKEKINIEKTNIKKNLDYNLKIIADFKITMQSLSPENLELLTKHATTLINPLKTSYDKLCTILDEYAESKIQSRHRSVEELRQVILTNKVGICKINYIKKSLIWCLYVSAYDYINQFWKTTSPDDRKEKMRQISIAWSDILTVHSNFQISSFFEALARLQSKSLTELEEIANKILKAANTSRFGSSNKLTILKENLTTLGNQFKNQLGHRYFTLSSNSIHFSRPEEITQNEYLDSTLKVESAIGLETSANEAIENQDKIVPIYNSVIPKTKLADIDPDRYKDWEEYEKQIGPVRTKIQGL